MYKEKLIAILKKHIDINDFELKAKAFHINYEMFLLHQQLIEQYIDISFSKDRADWLYWWMYEADFGKNKSIANSVVINNLRFELETPEQFVEFLMDDRNEIK